MLREEVIKVWEVCKEELKSVLLTPQEKVTYRFLQRSKTANFLIYGVGDLDQLERDINYENQRELKIENNDMLIDYKLLWGRFASLILNWIREKRWVNGLLIELEEKEGIERDLERYKKVSIRKRELTLSVMNSLKAEVNRPLDLSFLVGSDEKNFELVFERFNVLSRMIKGFDYYRDIHEPSVDDED